MGLLDKKSESNNTFGIRKNSHEFFWKDYEHISSLTGKPVEHVDNSMYYYYMINLKSDIEDGVEYSFNELIDMDFTDKCQHTIAFIRDILLICGLINESDRQLLLREGISEENAMLTIDDLNLNPRVYKLLRDNGYSYLLVFMNASYKNLLKLKSCGVATLDDLERSLHEYGYYIKDYPSSRMDIIVDSSEKIESDELKDLDEQFNRVIAAKKKYSVILDYASQQIEDCDRQIKELYRKRRELSIKNNH